MAEEIGGEIRVRLIAEGEVPQIPTKAVVGGPPPAIAPETSQKIKETSEELRKISGGPQGANSPIVMGFKNTLLGVIGALGIATSLTEIARQSKILSTFASTTAQLTGTMVDIILAPIAPLLFQILGKTSEGIAKFAKMWITPGQAWEERAKELDEQQRKREEIARQYKIVGGEVVKRTPAVISTPITLPLTFKTLLGGALLPQEIERRETRERQEFMKAWKSSGRETITAETKTAISAPITFNFWDRQTEDQVETLRTSARKGVEEGLNNVMRSRR